MTGPFMILFVPTDYEPVNKASSRGKLVELVHLAAILRSDLIQQLLCIAPVVGWPDFIPGAGPHASVREDGAVGRGNSARLG